MPARLAYANLFARDIEALAAFYAALFGFEEIAGHRSPIYRCLDAGGMELGFNAHRAYELLGLDDRKPAGSGAATTAYFTFEIDTAGEVDAAAAKATALGGTVIKPPYLTYYNARQAVLADPEGNVFRVNHRLGPRPPFDQSGLKL